MYVMCRMLNSDEQFEVNDAFQLEFVPCTPVHRVGEMVDTFSPVTKPQRSSA